MKRFAKYAAALAVVTLLGAGCATAPAPEATPNTNAAVGEAPSKPAEGTFTVKIMPDNTFQPTTAWVKAGTKVTWTNTDNDSHQLRANPHPTHDSNPTFGPRDPLKAGESYTYTFDRAERFNYHDHLNPAFGGAIVVQ